MPIEIDQPTIKQVASILFEIAKRDIAAQFDKKTAESLWRKETPFVTGAYMGNSNSPSVILAYEAFIGLPDDHPLKKEKEPKTVIKGYQALEPIGFDPNRSIDDLLSHVLPYMPMLI